jgi:GNAT superfamily N-acetyltransferase
MDRDAVLAAFNEQMRRRPEVGAPGRRVEQDGPVVRSVPESEGGWAGVTWSDLDETNADAVIAAQVARFADVGRPWEWKLYSYDRPADLPDRLRAAGFTPEPEEALLVAAIADLDLDVPPPDGLELRPVSGRRDAEALVAVHDEVFGGDHAAIGENLLAGLAREPASMAGVVAVCPAAGDKPVCAARVEFHDGTEFASLWGGGTLPEWRGRGVFRAVVAYRAALAAARGFTYLQVDASPDSRPILRRLGFAELAMTTPFVSPAT